MRFVAHLWLLSASLNLIGLITCDEAQASSSPRILELGRSVPLEWQETVLVEPGEVEPGEDGHLEKRLNSNYGSGAIGAGGVPTAPGQTQNVSAVSDLNVTTNPAAGTTNGHLPGTIGNSDDPYTDIVNCSDITTGRADRCWEELKLSDYVMEFLNAGICKRGEGFSTCFLRTNGFPALDCSVISPNGCSPPQSDIINRDAKKFYVAYNIYAINHFFHSWWSAIADSGQTASDNIGKIVQIIDVPKTNPVVVQWVLIALQAIFALIPGPLGVASHKDFYDISAQWQFAAQLVSNAIATVPNIGRFIFPSGDADSKIIQVAELSAQFGSILNQVKDNLNLTLISVMASAPEFLAFASQGNFSATVPSLPDQSNYLYYAFNTYLISQCFAGNNVVAVIGRGTNVQQLATNGTKTAYKIPCKTYNKQGLCDAWYYSKTYDSSFSLDNLGWMNRNYNKELQQLFQNFTTGQLLFEGAYACNSEGGFGAPANITISAAGINTACVSQMKVYTWDMSCTPGEGLCEWIEGPRQDTFGFVNRRNPGVRPAISVPYGYLGPAIANPGLLLDRT